MDFELPVLETERLILRKVTLEDLEDIFSYGSIEEVTKICYMEYTPVVTRLTSVC